MFGKIKKLGILSAVIVLWPFVNCLAWIFRFKNRKSKSILIFNNAKIGDMVCITPTFRAIKQKYPDSNLSIIINPKTRGVLKNNPRLDEIISLGSDSFIRLLLWGFKKNFSGSVIMVPGTLNYILPYLLCIPVRSSATAPEYGLFYRSLAFFTSTHTKRLYPDELSVQHYLDLLKPIGIYDSNLKKEIYFKPEARDRAEHFLVSHGWDTKTPLVGFSVSAGNKMKEWPPEKFMEVAKRVYKKYSYIPVFFGSSGDWTTIDQFSVNLKAEKIPFIVATEFSLEDLPACMSFLSYFIAVDTGTIYIANALGVPVVDIAGPCNILDQMPIYDKCEAVYIKNLPGWPYTSVLKTIAELSPEQMRCIDDITPDMVFGAFEKLSSKYDAKRHQ